MSSENPTGFPLPLKSWQLQVDQIGLKHFSTKWTYQAIADEFGLPRKTIIMAVKVYTNRHDLEILHARSLNHAYEILLQRNQNQKNQIRNQLDKESST